MVRLRRYRSKPLPEAVKAEIRRLLLAGMRWRDICEEVDVSQQTIAVVLRQAGGMPSRRIGRCPGQLSLAEREEISRGLIAGEAYACDRQSGWPGQLRRCRARSRRMVAGGVIGRGLRIVVPMMRACRPKTTKLSQSPGLVAYVENGLELRWSPEQISSRIIDEFPDDPDMRVSPETIYKELFVQGRGSLRKELAQCLRSGRARRRPRTRRSGGEGKIVDKVMISQASRRGRGPGGAGPLGRRPHCWQGRSLRDRHPGRAFHPVRDAAPPRRRPDRRDRHATRWPPRSSPCTRRCDARSPGTREPRWPNTPSSPSTPACRSTSATRTPLAARHQREHQRPAPPVLPQGHRPIDLHRRRPRRRRRPTQRPATQNPQLEDPI